MECYDVIILTETWLSPNILDSEFIDSRYNVFRCDRNRDATGKKDGGGTLIAVHRSVITTRSTLKSVIPLNFDYVLLKLNSHNKNKYHIMCSVYIPPNQLSTAYESFFNALQTEIEYTNVDNIYILGDFNLPYLEWSKDSFSAYNVNISSCNTPHSQIISNFLSFLNCKQYNNILNNYNRFLDLFICNNNLISCETPINALVPIDSLHPPFCVSLKFTQQSVKSLPKNLAPRYQFLQGNYAKINNDINEIDWIAVLSGVSVELATSRFYDIIYGIIKIHVPLRMPRSNSFPVWFSPSLIHVFKNKETAWIKWKKYKNRSDYEIFSVLRHRFKILSQECFNKYITSVESNIHKDVKAFWSYVNRQKKNTGTPNTMFYGDDKSQSPNGICELFSRYFSSVYEKPTPDNCDPGSPSYLSVNSLNFISNINVSEGDVAKELLDLDVCKGPGPDLIPPFFLKYTADAISLPLSIIYNLSIREGIVPSIWKAADVTPVYKSGCRLDVSNYRPISKISTVSKVLERLVHKAIYPSLHNVIINQQHGFVKKRSTITNLLLYTSYLFESIDDCVQVHSIYTDFSKAFDKVDHILLLKKLVYNGIHGNLLRWFSSYIINRTQKVVINGFSSNEITVTSGVPQGSILGPLLFIIFINDIGECFHNSQFLLYADDLKVYCRVKTLADCLKLQGDLYRLQKYCLSNKLFLNLNKCKVMNITKKANIIDFDYSLCDTYLEKVAVIKDLGLFIDSKLHFDAHIKNIINKAYQMYGLIMRTCSAFKRPSSYLLLYKSLVRCQLEYATVIWNPVFNKYKESIEIVQRKFLRSLNYKCFHSKSSYQSSLVKFSIPTLNSRRLLLDQKLLYNVCHNTFDCNQLINQIYFRIPSGSQRIRENHTQCPFAPKRCRTIAGERAPLRRIMKSHNDYFTDVDIFHLGFSSYKNKVSAIIADMINADLK